MAYKYQHAILGGTFDHFHLGHKEFIFSAANQAKELTIGIVQKIFSSEKIYPNSIESYSKRLANLKSFLQQSDLTSKTKLIPLNDIYGTALTDLSVDAIFVTIATSANATKINLKRQQLSLPSLEMICVPYSRGDDSEIISSGRIRSGIIDRDGNSYLKYLLKKNRYEISPSLREILQHPIGQVISTTKELEKLVSPASQLISVGDIVSMKLVESGYHPSISILDYKNRRQVIDSPTISKFFPTIHYRLDNQSGSVNSKIGNLFLAALHKSNNTQHTQVIKIDGEEDLLALPAILLSPLSTYVIYGQHNLGMVVVEVTEKIKTKAKEYLSQFE